MAGRPLLGLPPVLTILRYRKFVGGGSAGLDSTPATLGERLLQIVTRVGQGASYRRLVATTSYFLQLCVLCHGSPRHSSRTVLRRS